MSKGKSTCKPSGGKKVSQPKPIAKPSKPSVAMTGGGPRKKGYA